MTITTTTPREDVSPFDAIKRTREDGTEFWSGRDLMPMLGYEKWDRFSDSVERAMATLGNLGHDVEREASRLREPSGTTRQMRGDFHLSRFAAYLVAMNGDPRKPEVAAAQAYFAIKTREAEVSPAANPELVTRADMARMILAAEEEKAVLAAALESAAPAIAYHDRYVANDDAATVKVWGAQYGLTQPQAFALLLEKNAIYRQHIGQRWSGTKQAVVDEYEYRARAGRVSFAWFDLRPQHNAPRHHNGQVRQTLYVRQEHALDLAVRVGLATRTLRESS